MKIFKAPVKKHFSQRTTLGEFLLKLTNLKPAEIGDAATKGAVWIQRSGKGKILRIRSLNETISPEDVIQINYDANVLKFPEVSDLEPIFEDQNYGVWLKPAGVVPQGSQAGDHASLLRYVEKRKNKEVYLVHRLDRETVGLMIIAYTPQAATFFGNLFQENKISKEYQAIVLGSLPVGSKKTITASLDDKDATTHYEVIDATENRSLLKITIDTGRLHQIRRHLDSIGHPVMGDPKYGKGNKNREGLKLLAYSLSFQDPWLKQLQIFKAPMELSLVSKV